MTMPMSITVHFIDMDAENRASLFSPLLPYVPRRDDEVQVDDARYRVVGVVWILHSDTDTDTDTAPEVELEMKRLVDVEPWAVTD